MIGRRARGSRTVACALALLAALLLAACGSSSKPQLDVSAAASLRQAFTRYGQQLASIEARFSFAGSDALAAQIEQGIRPDVFASANAQLPATLFAKGLVLAPVVFAAIDGSRSSAPVMSTTFVRNLLELQEAYNAYY